jgi:glutathione S-transferase
VILYCATIDADCFAARLLLAVLGREYEAVAVDAYPGLDQLSRQVLKAGPLPILEDDGKLFAGLRAVFEHLATPSPWLDFACDDLTGLKNLRQQSLAGDLPTEAELSEARRTLLVLEDELTVVRLRGRRWFSDVAPGEDPAADLALYPAVALSRDVGLEHDEFPALRHWLRDVRALAPAVHMPGVLDPI